MNFSRLLTSLTNLRGLFESPLFRFIASIYLLFVLVVSWIFFETEQSSQMARIDKKLLLAAEHMQLEFGLEWVDRYTPRSPPSPDTFRNAVAGVSALAQKMGAAYLYIVVPEEGAYYFLVSSEQANDQERGLGVTFWERYDTTVPELIEALKTKSPVFSPGYTDKWGSFYSVFIPVRSAAGTWYAIGADVEVEAIERIMLKVATKTAGIALIFLLMMLPVVWLYHNFNRIVKKQRIKAQKAAFARRMQRHLDRKSAFEQALIDTIPYPLFYKDKTCRFVGVNKAYEEAFGVKRDYLIAKQVLDLEYLPYEDRLLYQQEDETVIRTAGTLYKEMLIPFKDGVMHRTLYACRALPTPRARLRAWSASSLISVSLLRPKRVRLPPTGLNPNFWPI